MLAGRICNDPPDVSRGHRICYDTSLPSQIDPAALGVRSKAPYQLLVIRETLIWRTEELARNACAAIEKEDFAVAALLARAVAESAAMTWYLVKVLEERAGYTPDQLNDKLMQLLVGMKRKKDKTTEPNADDLPEAINVVTFVKHVSRELPGFDEGLQSIERICPSQLARRRGYLSEKGGSGAEISPMGMQ